MLGRLTGLISWDPGERNRDTFQKIGEYTIEGKKTSLWLAKSAKKLYMNLKGNRLFIFKKVDTGGIEICFKRGGKECAPREKDIEDVLSNLEIILLKKEKKPSKKLIINDILDAVSDMKKQIYPKK